MGATGTWYAHGKLLITGEYLVLRGAKALAIPLRYGQSLTINRQEGPHELDWTAEIPGKTWFTAQIETDTFQIRATSDETLANRLSMILRSARVLNPEFLTGSFRTEAVSALNFDPEWGIGSSSSLIANLSRWAGVDPFELNKNIFGSSGYDIAASLSPKPIIYQLENGSPKYESVELHPPLSRQIWLVYQNKKENSRSAVRKFSEIPVPAQTIDAISKITLKISETTDFSEWLNLMEEHEQIMAQVLNQVTVRQRLFSDFEGSIKSLGAWGGDFLLVASHRKQTYVRDYFTHKGLQTIFSYDDIVA